MSDRPFSPGRLTRRIPVGVLAFLAVAAPAAAAHCAPRARPHKRSAQDHMWGAVVEAAGRVGKPLPGAVGVVAVRPLRLPGASRIPISASPLLPVTPMTLCW